MRNLTFSNPAFAQNRYYLRLIIAVGVLLLLVQSSLLAQNSTNNKPHEWLLTLGVGTASAADIADRSLAQDQGGFDEEKYRLGVQADAIYQWNAKWGASVLWTLGCSTGQNKSLVNRKYQSFSKVNQSFSLLLERRFAVKSNRYFYWGFGAGLYHTHTKKTPRESNLPLETKSAISFMPQLKPIGVCYDANRVKTYIELGLFSLPLVNVGIRVRI